jgi:thioredoxin
MINHLDIQCEKEIQQLKDDNNKELLEKIEQIKKKYNVLKTKSESRLIKSVTLEDFKQTLEQANDKLVVVDFTATWCGPCKRIAPKFEEMANATEDIVFIKVDIDDNPDTAEACTIKCMPTFQFYKNAKQVDEFSGADINKLQEYINKLT